MLKIEVPDIYLLPKFRPVSWYKLISWCAILHNNKNMCQVFTRDIYPSSTFAVLPGHVLSDKYRATGKPYYLYWYSSELPGRAGCCLWPCVWLVKYTLFFDMVFPVTKIELVEGLRSEIDLQFWYSTPFRTGYVTLNKSRENEFRLKEPSSIELRSRLSQVKTCTPQIIRHFRFSVFSIHRFYRTSSPAAQKKTRNKRTDGFKLYSLFARLSSEVIGIIGLPVEQP